MATKNRNPNTMTIAESCAAGMGRNATAKPNDRLTAAAPQLLAVLQSIVAVCPECDGRNDATLYGEHVECGWCGPARAAIAKATN